MEPDDDDLDADGVSGPLLPPDDRLWRHPSEVFAAPSGALSFASPGSSGRSPTSGRWLVAVLSGLTGALVVTTIIGITVGFGSNTTTDRAALGARALVNTTLAALAPTTSLAKLGALDASAAATVEIRAADTQRAVGAGVEIGGGYVLTAASLLSGVNAVQVANVDGVIDAVLVGTSASLGVALLLMENADGKSAPLGSVLPLSANGAVVVMTPSGHFGAKLRSNDAEMGLLYPLLLIEPPQSVVPAGSVVLDRNGNVVAMVIDKANDGALLAVPVDAARPAAGRMISGGNGECGWLGIEGADGDGHVRIASVAAGSPAERAGLRADDRIVAIGSSKDVSIRRLGLLVRSHGGGESMRFTVKRGDQTMALEVTLASRVAPA